MKKLLSLIICLILIPVLILGGALAAVYFTYFNPQPAEYSYLNPVEEIVSIEFAEVSFTDGNVSANGIGFIEDIEGFMDDLNSLDCHEGLSIDAIVTLVKTQEADGLVINYADGSYEIITPYVCVNSELSIQSVEDVLNMNIYGYDVEQFKNMLEGYKELYLDLGTKV